MADALRDSLPHCLTASLLDWRWCYPPQSKLLYHAFHKLFELKRLAQRQPLHVRLQGEEHDFVMHIRTKPLTVSHIPHAQQPPRESNTHTQ